MRRATCVLGVATVAAVMFVAASALAQGALERTNPSDTDFTAAVEVTPSKAGTKQSPRGITINAADRITTERGLDAPIVTGIELRLGKGFSTNGGKYAKCSKRVLDRQGLDGCPKASIMGGLIATARAGTVTTQPRTVFVNGGEQRLYAYTRLDFPARVQETIVLRTAETSGRWHYTGTLRVPKSLQMVAGMPIQTTQMKLTIGGKAYAKDYLTTTSCPRGGWKYEATIHYLYDLTGQPGQDTVGGVIPCTS